MSSPSYSLRRDRDVNVGDRTRLSGSERKTLAWKSVDASSPLTIYASAIFESPWASRSVVVMTLEWGHGGASVATEIPFAGHLRVPLVASSVTLEGRLVDLDTGLSPRENVVCDVSAFIAEGVDGQGLPVTLSKIGTGSQGVLGVGPHRVVSLRGYNASSFDAFLMLFDAAAVPATGAEPLLACPAPSGGREPFAMTLVGPRLFAHGLSWALSYHPFELHSTSGQVRLDVEVLP